MGFTLIRGVEYVLELTDHTLLFQHLIVYKLFRILILHDYTKPSH